MTKCILICIMVAVLLPGCAWADSITPDQAKVLGYQIELLSGRLSTYQEIVTKTAQDLQSAGIISDSDMAKVVELNSKINEVVPKIADVAKAIQSGQYSEDSKGIITVLEGLRAANTATSPWNQYAVAFDAILGLVIAGLTLLLKRKNDQTKVAESTLRTVARAVDASLPSTQEDVKKKIREIGNTAEGKALISRIKTA